MAQPIVSNLQWQQRFNDLLDRPTEGQAPPTKPLNAAHALEMKAAPAPVLSMSKPIATEFELGRQLVQPLSWSSPIPITILWEGRDHYVKNEDSASTKSLDEKVFDQPENGSRPTISMIDANEDNRDPYKSTDAFFQRQEAQLAEQPAIQSAPEFKADHDKREGLSVKLNSAAPQSSQKALVPNHSPTKPSGKVDYSSFRGRKSRWAKPPRKDRINTVNPRND